MGQSNRRKNPSYQPSSEVQQALSIAATVREPLLILNSGLEVLAANEEFYAAFGLQETGVKKFSVFSLQDYAWDLPALRHLLEELLTSGASFREKEISFDLEYLGNQTSLVNGTVIKLREETLVMLTFSLTKSVVGSLFEDLDHFKTTREVVMNAPAIMCSLRGPNHIYELANKAYCELIGNRNIIGKPVREALPEVQSQGFIQILDEVYRTGKEHRGHEVPVTLEPEGKAPFLIYTDFLYQPVRDLNGSVRGIFVHGVDVTEKVLARKRVEESEAELKNLVDTLPVIVWISDENGQGIYANQKWFDYTGQSGEESKGLGAMNAIHPEERDQVEKLFSEAFSERKPYKVLCRIRTRDGEYRWMVNHGNPRFDENGNFQGMVGAMVDVHEDIMKTHLIREKDHRTRSIVEEATIATAVYIGPDMKIELANDAMINLWGKDRNVVGKKLRDALPELEGQPFFDLLGKVYSTGKTYWGKEDRVDLLKDGEMKTGYFNFSYKPLRNEKGEIYGILNMAMDVSHEWLAKQKLEESERKYQEIIYSSPAMIATFEGEDLVIKIANDTALEVWGKGKDVVGKPFFSVMPEFVDQGIHDIFREVYTTGKTYRDFEKPVKIIRNGKEQVMYFNFVSYPQRDIHGNITGIVDIATEVTPQAVLNKKIKDSESHFRRLADLMPEKVLNSDAQGKVIYFNQHWINYTGLTSKQLMEEGWKKKIYQADRARFEAEWERSMASGESMDMEIRLLNKDGDYKWHLFRAEAVRDENARIKMWIGTNTDIQRLKEEEKRKEDFLKMVSHELKTPVTSIKGYVQLLLTMLKTSGERKLSALPLQPSLERIDHQVTRLTRLISEMLDLSRIEENKLELQKVTFNINELVNETVQDIRYTNTQHQLEVHHECECLVYADKDRIGQVLINLITNAIKYSPESQLVEVSVTESPQGNVRVSIRDQGIGIDKADHENIFKRFYRINEENEDTYSGFGIGLYLANEIVHRHGGYLEVNSEKGKGAEFSFILDIASPT